MPITLSEPEREVQFPGLDLRLFRVYVFWHSAEFNRIYALHGLGTDHFPACDGATGKIITSACQKILRDFEQYKWWNQDNLFAFLMEMLLDLGATNAGVVIVLGALEEDIASCDWFLNKLNKLADKWQAQSWFLRTSKDTEPGKMALCVHAEDKPQIETTGSNIILLPLEILHAVGRLP